MARSKKVREASPAYVARPMSEVFWLAFQSLSDEEQAAFVQRLLADPDTFEEIADAMTIITSRDQPRRPFSEFAEELKREGRL